MKRSFTALLDVRWTLLRVLEGLIPYTRDGKSGVSRLMRSALQQQANYLVVEMLEMYLAFPNICDPDE